VNEEKVVNPPQSPVVRKSNTEGDRLPVLPYSAYNKPIRKLPDIFTANVAIGKGY
jgi:hypothetical protein